VVKLQTNFGDITIELDAEKAPITVANFLAYVESGFYNNTIFHRVIDGFMIQGGGFTETMSQKPTQAEIKNEANNGLANKNIPLRWHAPLTQIQLAASSLSTLQITTSWTLAHQPHKDGATAYLAKWLQALRS